MKNNYIDDLIRAVTRVVTPNVPLLKEVLVIGGMPEKTQNLQYLSYNRNTTIAKGQSLEFSAVAVINNRRADEWRLTGYSQKLSQWIFSKRWTRNPLDLFINNLRCEPAVITVLDRAPGNYSLLGILTVTDLQGSGLIQRRAQYICPVVATPGIDADELKVIKAFETANQIKKTGFIGLHVYHKKGNQMAGV
jgi:hypothetical protein